MPEHPFLPEDFPIDEDHEFKPTEFYFLKGAVHFKKTAQILDMTHKVKKSRWRDFSQSFLRDVDNAAKKAEEDEEKPKYEITSCGEMMRTIKTMVDGQKGEKICELSMTFVSFDSSMVRFADKEHSRHPLEICPVEAGSENKHECFVRHSIPYFWDMSSQFGVLYKCLNQKRVKIGMVCAFGFGKDAVLALEGDQLDDVCAISTCVILLNGRDAMDH
ncbi:hypothetical protein PG994_010641 [Apiospora phragmitis]|uniref:Uncharacterized protein n=1 Tax=Apiospora phragmitis TaxID=2905665 RepID=A0ABR1TQH6_9PEZI